MRVEIVKKFSKEFIQKELARLEKKYKGMHELRERALEGADGQANPSIIDDLFYWQALVGGAEVYERVSFCDASIFSDLTPKRMEVLDFLATNGAGSIKEMAGKLKRDYKNIYDDVMALQKHGLIEFVRAGKKTKPLMLVESITIEPGA